MNTLNTEILDNIIKTYLPSDLSKKFRNIYSPQFNEIISGGKNRKRTVSKASLLKYSQRYAENFIPFVNDNLSENSLPQLILNVSEAFYTAGFNDAAIILLSEIMEKINNNNQHRATYSSVLLTLGRIYSDKELLRKSNGFVREAEKIFLQTNNIYGLVRCNNLLAVNHAENGSLQKSVQYFMKCLSLLEKEDNELLSALIEMNIGVIYHLGYNFSKSLYFSQRALLKFNKNKDSKNVGLSKFNIASNYYAMKKYGLALKMLEQCSSISIESGMLEQLGAVYYTKALVFLKTDDMKMAVAFWGKSLEIFERINDPKLKYQLILTRGLIARKQKKYEFSEKCLLDAKKFLLKYNYKIVLGDNEYELAVLYAEWGKMKKAQASFEIALQIFKKMKIDYMVNKIENDRKELLSA